MFVPDPEIGYYPDIWIPEIILLIRRGDKLSNFFKCFTYKIELFTQVINTDHCLALSEGLKRARV